MDDYVGELLNRPYWYEIFNLDEDFSDDGEEIYPFTPGLNAMDW